MSMPVGDSDPAGALRHRERVEAALRAQQLLDPSTPLDKAFRRHERQLEEVRTRRLSKDLAPVLQFFLALLQRDGELLGRLQAEEASSAARRWQARRCVTKPSLLLEKVVPLLASFTAEYSSREWMLACELLLAITFCVHAQGFKMQESELKEWLPQLERTIRHVEIAVGYNLHGMRHACLYTLSCACLLLRGQSSDSVADYATLSFNCLQTLLSVAGSHFHIQILLGVESKAGAVVTQLGKELLGTVLKRWSQCAAAPLLLMWPQAHMETTVENIRRFQETFGPYMMESGPHWQRKVAYLAVLHAQLQRVLDMQLASLRMRRVEGEAASFASRAPLSPAGHLLRLSEALLFGAEVPVKAPRLHGLVSGHDFKRWHIWGDWRVREKSVTVVVDLLLSCKKQMRDEPLAADEITATMHHTLAQLFVQRCIMERVQSVRETIDWAWRNHLQDLWDGNTRSVLEGDAFRRQLLALMSAKFEAAQEHSRQERKARRQQEAARGGKGRPASAAPPRARGVLCLTAVHAWKRAKLNLLCIGVTVDQLRSRQVQRPAVPSDASSSAAAPAASKREHQWHMVQQLSDVLEESGEAPSTAEFAVALEQQVNRLTPLLEIAKSDRTPAQADAREHLHAVKKQLKQLVEPSIAPLLQREMRRVREELGPEPTTDEQDIEIEMTSDESPRGPTASAEHTAAIAPPSSSRAPVSAVAAPRSARVQPLFDDDESAKHQQQQQQQQAWMQTLVRGGRLAPLEESDSTEPDLHATLVRSATVLSRS